VAVGTAPDAPHAASPVVTSITGRVWLPSPGVRDRRDFCFLVVIHTVEMDNNEP
jgi:hypothetical protein